MLAVPASLLSCAAAVQVLFQTFCISGLRARQLASSAGQACARSSLCQPGSSLQLAARQGAAGGGLGGSAGGQTACVTGGQVSGAGVASGAEAVGGGVMLSGAGVGLGALAQPASRAAIRGKAARASLYSRLCRCLCGTDGAIMLEDGSWIFFLEAAVAGGVLILIVWSTWPKDKNAIDRTAQSSAEHSRNSAAPESQDEPR